MCDILIVIAVLPIKFTTSFLDEESQFIVIHTHIQRLPPAVFSVTRSHIATFQLISGSFLLVSIVCVCVLIFDKCERQTFVIHMHQQQHWHQPPPILAGATFGYIHYVATFKKQSPNVTISYTFAV